MGDFVKSIKSFESGGNCSVDLITLKDGRVLGINGECVVLYASMADFNDCETVDRHFFINLAA